MTNTNAPAHGRAHLKEQARRFLNKRGVALAFVVSSVLAIVIGLLSNVAANTLEVNEPRVVWIALILTFLISLPINLYLFLHSPAPTPTTTDTPGPTPRSQALPLPSRPYGKFFGRETLVDDIMHSLREPDRRKIIGIDGMGGIGKTALAREVTELCIEESLFDVVIWEPRESDVSFNATVPLTWDYLVTTVGRQLGAPDIQRLTEAEKAARFKTLLESQRVLLILDNLETAAIGQDNIVTQLAPLLSSSKAILTSRRRFKGDVYSVNLSGLEEDSAVQMLRYEAGERGVTQVATAPLGDLRTLARTTGGSPLALKLVIGQLQYLSLETVINAIKEVRIEADGTDEDDYVRFYKSIFWSSWELLSESAQQLLVSMSVLAPNLGGTAETIQAVAQVNEEVMTKVIGELWRFSFVEVGERNLRKRRYYLHPLTQYFVLSDVVKPPSTA